jgi:sugar phosphate isomerase/epimerase
MVKFSAFADEVSSDFEEQLAFLNTQQVGNIEIRSLYGKNILDLSKGELIAIKRMLKDHGISVSAIGSPIGKIGLDQPFEPHLDRFRYAVELADFFGAPFIRVFSFYAAAGKDINDFRDEVLRRMSLMAGMLTGSKIVLVHENESHIYGHTAEHCADIARSVNSPNLKLVYDPGNFVWGGNITDNMDRCWPVMAPYVVHIHIKDWKLGSLNIGSVPGEGDGQIDILLKKLAEIQYNGFLTMEPHLESGGQFGGKSDPVLFEKAIRATRELAERAELPYC